MSHIGRMSEKSVRDYAGALEAVNANLQSELTAARDEAERLRGRVAIMEEFVADAQMDAWRALDPDYVPPAVESAMKSLLHRAATITQEVDPDDIALSAWLLRKQAEAVDEVEGLLCVADTAGDMARLSNDYAQRLRQQADELERLDGRP